MDSYTIKRYTVTAALPYANGPLHIGHIAGAYLPADIFVRYLRLHRYDVAFICGSDEHGAAITLRAKKEGITPQEIIDKYHSINKQAFADFGISFDIFHRTSAPLHYETAQDFFKKLDANGEFEVQSSEQFFDEEFQQFLADHYIMGNCPKCSHPDAYGDQCEKCGSSLNPTDLIQPRSILSGKQPILKETKHWYLPMQRHQQWLEEWIATGSFTGIQLPITPHNPDAWKQNVKGQCLSWLKDGLKSRAMTRDLDWGVPVPVSGGEGKVLYVWLDAPIGYISATRQWAAEQGKDWNLYWKNEDTRLIHFIGKDNIVFHCIIFPIMLHATGEYIVPDNVPANEFMNLEGDKMSTSRGWSIEMHDYLKDFPGKPDVLRYALLTNLPESKDSEFTWKDFQAKNNNELVAIFGNFVNRAAVLTQKYFDNKVPIAHQLTELEDAVLKELSTFPERIARSIEEYRFREATAHLMDVARLGNKYLAETEPWKLAKTDLDRVATILNTALQISANLALLCEPFLPFTAERLKAMLNLTSTGWQQAGSASLLAAGQPLQPSQLLFEKIEDDIIEAQIKKLNDSKRQKELDAQPVPPLKPEIVFDDFGKLDIRIGKVVAAEKMAKSDKLLKLTVNSGLDQRVILSGIAKHYSAEEMVGKQITFIANLAPRNLMGVESQGMVLMAEDKDGSVRLLQPDNDVAAGSPVS